MAEVKRIVADYTPEAYEVLSAVAEQLNTGKADALRRALDRANFILRQQKEGRKVRLLPSRLQAAVVWGHPLLKRSKLYG